MLTKKRSTGSPKKATFQASRSWGLGVSKSQILKLGSIEEKSKLNNLRMAETMQKNRLLTLNGDAHLAFKQPASAKEAILNIGAKQC
jgi:hypothetical protein